MAVDSAPETATKFDTDQAFAKSGSFAVLPIVCIVLVSRRRLCCPELSGSSLAPGLRSPNPPTPRPTCAAVQFSLREREPSINKGEHGHDHDPLPEHQTSDFNRQSCRVCCSLSLDGSIFRPNLLSALHEVKHEWFAKDGWVCEPDIAVLDLQHNGGVMDRAMSRLNIEHYRRKLATEQYETTRQTLMHLLAEEQAKLAALDNSRERRQPRLLERFRPLLQWGWS